MDRLARSEGRKHPREKDEQPGISDGSPKSKTAHKTAGRPIKGAIGEDLKLSLDQTQCETDERRQHLTTKLKQIANPDQPVDMPFYIFKATFFGQTKHSASAEAKMDFDWLQRSGFAGIKFIERTNVQQRRNLVVSTIMEMVNKGKLDSLTYPGFCELFREHHYKHMPDPYDAMKIDYKHLSKCLKNVSFEPRLKKAQSVNKPRDVVESIIMGKIRRGELTSLTYPGYVKLFQRDHYLHMPDQYDAMHADYEHFSTYIKQLRFEPLLNLQCEQSSERHDSQSPERKKTKNRQDAIKSIIRNLVGKEELHSLTYLKFCKMFRDHYTHMSDPYDAMRLDYKLLGESIKDIVFEPRLSKTDRKRRRILDSWLQGITDKK